MSHSPIVVSDLSFAWPDDTPVFRDLTFSLEAERVGLVAPNGAGKSTLLRLIAGRLTATTGSIAVAGVLGYLPQDLPLTADRTVAEVLGVADVIAALDAIESGDTAEQHFTVVGDDWDVEDRARTELERLGLGHVTLRDRLDRLSGGQIVGLGLAALLLKRPDVLLLDEPTNNLDRAARHRLHEVLDGLRRCVLVVSHDRELLDHMDRIAELDRGEMRFYGGNFSAYQHTVAVEQEAAERNLRTAELLVKREKREMQQARERAERRAGNAQRNLKDAGLARIVAGGLKRSAEKSAGTARTMHAARVSEAKERADEAARAVRTEQGIALELPDTRVPAGRTLFEGEHLRKLLGDTEVFAGEGIDLAIRGPERIALSGANGVGKSTLLRLVHGDLEPDSGTIRRADGRIAYLSQRLDLLDDDRTVAENLASFAPSLPDARRLNILARFLFRGPRIHLPVRVLSGGERLRATLACVLYAEPAPHLLLLDEPTNNLDLVSVGQLENALNAYEGAFVVISHDARFLDAIKVERRLELVDGRLGRPAAGPRT
ncbi:MULTISPECIES: ABC-F family ATP-binding cassette domain-containing protein [Kitasatospora]|uniref:ABC-F family ATP-binding cassette domain-containing protein n=1 Tax=Kitasatospora cathayae TaxID=3004092 RepID=A0ABY7Q0Q3_9ACTN|nr:ABC-F family ATP-binding cassette domain-containing protein [Kitasatospora sp. HUAS 3-15]WBP86263.1 ABC-F family ATP-binding cassette domain-containing protein [Kitasatospora sp. HUAS 3-15]